MYRKRLLNSRSPRNIPPTAAHPYVGSFPSLRQWWILLIALVGAFGTAALMAVSQVQVGEAFTVVSAPVFDPDALFRIFLIIVAAGVARGILQFSRNFGFEFCAQRIERNVRRELYASLLSKSMTFHNLQPVGDTMARRHQ
jgi:ATP-binding cassette subfamily B protein